MTKKDRVVREFIKEWLEPNGIDLKKNPGTQGRIYGFDGKKINIKVRSKNDYPIWVDVAINDLNNIDYFIFLWYDIELNFKCAYVIPSDFLREKLKKHGRKNNSGRMYNFDIKVGDVLSLNKENEYPIKQCPINEFKNKISIDGGGLFRLYNRNYNQP